MNLVIETIKLKKSFGIKKVLCGFDLSVERGENVVVLGRSGSGKSILIKCVIGLVKPDSGEIKVFDESINNMKHQELDKLRVKIGFLFQSNALYDSMTVKENLLFPLRRHWIHKSKQETDDLVMEALNSVGLPETVDMMPVELSGGMRKRIGLARTLILKPEIILYDEPTSGLDPITSREIGNLMLDIQKKYNTSSVIISHDMNCVRLTANRIVVLSDGICYAQGTYNELKKSSDPKICQFFD